MILARSLLFPAFLASGLLGALAAPLEERASVEVSIANGTVVGASDGAVEYFKGIPFAQAPVGPLRFQSPRPYDASFGRLDATKAFPVCLQGADAKGSEDCLKLIVLRPANRPAAKLPVVFFIHGGAFSAGGAEDGNDGTPIVKASSQMGAPVILVSVQYRLGALGFLSGKEVAATGQTNLGLRDQRLALKWVHDNIAAFGGDPDKVTLWGFSAGSMSSFDHTIINEGNTEGLFRGVILSSGSPVSARDVSSSKAQAEYDAVVSKAGCSQSSNTLECLRNLDATALVKAASSLLMSGPWRGVNLPYLSRPDPSSTFFSRSADVALSEGKFAKVPVLTGDVEDEGTLFALIMTDVTNNQLLISHLNNYYPGNEQYVAGLAATYPDDLGISGSPYGTGLADNAFGQYKRLASIFGDIIFNWQRRYHLSVVSSQVPCWSYLNSAFKGTGLVGSFHGSDGLKMLSSGTDSATVTPQRYIISFINKLDPNALGNASPLIKFPQYSTANPQLVHIQAQSNELVKDDFRAKQYQYFSANLSKFRI